MTPASPIEGFCPSENLEHLAQLGDPLISCIAKRTVAISVVFS